MWAAADWEARALRAASGHERAIWLTVDGDDATHAMTGAAELEGGRTGEYVIWGMWVAPEARRRGVGTQLLDRSRDWSWEAGAERLSLWVVATNAAAYALYERAGFQPTGVSQPLRSHPDFDERLMELPRPEGK